MLIGRKKETKTFHRILHSREAEFVVLYGRRRVGKTFLVREYFNNQDCIFLQATGLQKGKLKVQLSKFAEVLSQTFTKGISIKTPSSWDDAFAKLNQLMENINEKIVVFLDEVPWMATRKSGFLEALDYYWNRYWSAKKNFILIICGSSASWLIKNIIYNKGGLHNRCTCEIKLDPFDLKETSEYLTKKNIHLNNRQVLELYMALGGIPYYLNYVEKGLSATEIIQKIFFSYNAPLKDEFRKLFSSLFKEAKTYIELIKIISRKKEGVSRVELEAATKSYRGGGRLTERLKDLENTSFIEAYIPWDRQRGEYYKVIDEFCLFYIYWLLQKKSKRKTEDYWSKQIEKPEYHVWAGYAFEAVCYKHIDKIVNALNLKTAEHISSWRMTAQGIIQGAQIDLLIDRSDDSITVFEIKYTDKPFIITSQYAETLKKKIKIFKEQTNTPKQIFLAFITANGLKSNKYSENLVTNVIVLDDLI